MTTERIRQRFAWMAAIALFVASPSWVQAEQATDLQGDPPSESADGLIQTDAHEEWARRREAILEEARSALEHTHGALTALENDDKGEALDALARATGKLEILLAREPDLALAPIGVDFVTHDLYATIESVRAARDQASELLDEGRVQEARALLSGLASEVVISVTNLPLGTYPQAIKAVSPLIDEGKLEEAKLALRAALETLVVTKHVISLPVARASHMLHEAESLLETEEVAEEGDEEVEPLPEKVAGLVQGARHQLEMAEVLGYGPKADHERFRKQIAELEKKIGTEQATDGIFARLQKSLESFETSFFE
jgi:soluble cytochrome b562